MTFHFNVAIPLDIAERFKAKVLITNFKADEPILTRHKDRKGFAYFTFESPKLWDINKVVGFVDTLCPFVDFPHYEIICK